MCTDDAFNYMQKTHCTYYQLLDYAMFSYDNEEDPMFGADDVINGDCTDSRIIDGSVMGAIKRKICYPQHTETFTNVEN